MAVSTLRAELVQHTSSTFFTTGTTSMMYSMTGDFYRTQQRAIGVGLASAVSRVPSTIAPFLSVFCSVLLY
ncbi:unnamed protein product [Clavelina lepadiformis]|uniref:Uncharacterized protein n=1 Tax=Clavelina lepadiformis TaxID=159417 RepID=A0ABP0EX79_CLALP